MRVDRSTAKVLMAGRERIGRRAFCSPGSRIRTFSAALLAISLLIPAARADEMANVFGQLLLNPGDPSLNLRYAELAMARGETSKAFAALERAKANNPGNRDIRRAYQKAKNKLKPPVTQYTLSTGLTWESNPRQLRGGDTRADSDGSLEASLLLYDERTIGSRRWRTLGQASGHLMFDIDDLNDIYLSIASGPVFDIGKKTQLHIAPGAGTAWLDDDWLYQDALVRVALERRNKGNAQTVTTTVKYRDTNSSFGGDDGLIVQVDGRFMKTSKVRQGDAFYFLPRFRYSEPGGDGPGRIFQNALFPGNYIEYGSRVLYYAPVLSKRAYLGAGLGLYRRDYDQNIALGTKNRSDTTLVPSAHLLVPKIKGSKFDFRMDYRYENNDSNDPTEDFNNHVISATTVRKF